MWQTILGILATLGLSALLARQLLDAMAKRRHASLHPLGEAFLVLDNAAPLKTGTAGIHRVSGAHLGLPAEVQLVMDGGPWLLVTIPATVPVASIFDLMMRPSEPAGFSDFGRLPHTIATPPDFPPGAAIRTDDPRHLLPADVVRPHLKPFFDGQARELLITPKGIRMVVRLAEDRGVRQGAFRPASPSRARVEAKALKTALDQLIALRASIEDWHRDAVPA